MKDTDPTKGCGKATKDPAITDEQPAMTAAPVTNLNATVLDPFLQSLKQGIYAGLVNEITRIGSMAARELERNIKLMATKIAMEISNEVSVSSLHNEMQIKIKLSQADLELIVSDTLKNFKR